VSETLVGLQHRRVSDELLSNEWVLQQASRASLCRAIASRYET